MMQLNIKRFISKLMNHIFHIHIVLVKLTFEKDFTEILPYIKLNARLYRQVVVNRIVRNKTCLIVVINFMLDLSGYNAVRRAVESV